MIACRKNLQWKYTLFYKQSSFSVQPQSCLTFPWTELRMLLNTYNHHHTRTLFIFTIFVSMSRPRSVCVVSMWSFFHFHLHFHYGWSCNLINTDTLVFLLIFKNIPYYFWMMTWMKNVNNFQTAKVQPQSVALHLLDFLPISA